MAFDGREREYRHGSGQQHEHEQKSIARRPDLSPPEPVEAHVLAGTEPHPVQAQATGREYRILLAPPDAPPPPNGYPVIYLLDAEMCFVTAAEALRWQTRPPKGFEPAVLVGIAYPGHLDRVKERFLDYTTPADPAALPVRGNGEPWPPVGGAEAFLDFVETGLMPAVEARFPTDRSRRAFIGHSLGGFLVLHALFTRARMFRTYVAGSPSIWWNGHVLLEEEAAFTRKLLEQSPGGERELTVFLGAGGREGGGDSRMLENAMEMGERLSALKTRGLSAFVQEFAGEGHISVVPALLARGIRLALAQTEEERAWNV